MHIGGFSFSAVFTYCSQVTCNKSPLNLTMRYTQSSVYRGRKTLESAVKVCFRKLDDLSLLLISPGQRITALWNLLKFFSVLFISNSQFCFVFLPFYLLELWFILFCFEVNLSHCFWLTSKWSLHICMCFRFTQLYIDWHIEVIGETAWLCILRCFGWLCCRLGWPL